MTQLTTARIMIATNITNANVLDGVFIAPAGLTPAILIGKHKVKGAAWPATKNMRWKQMAAYPAPTLTWRRAH